MSSEDLSESSDSYNQNEEKAPSRSKHSRLRKISQKQNHDSNELPKRSLRPKRETTVRIDQSEDFSENEANNGRELIRLLNPPVESIHSRRIEAGKRQYLIRYSGKSLSNCQWVAESEILERDPGIKMKLKRFDGIFDGATADSEAEIKTVGIDADCTNVDRILNCSEIFVLVHPKKASDLHNKWNDGLIRVMRALINICHKNIFYGVFYIQLMDVVKHYPEFEEAIDFSVIVNRIYLDSYASPDKFWDDLESVFRTVDRFCLYIDEKSDVAELNERMKQLTAVLYAEWLDIINCETAVFKAKIASPAFADDLEIVKNGFRTIFETGTANQRSVVKLFEEYQHLLKFPMKSDDCSFEQASVKIQQLKQILGDQNEQSNGNSAHEAHQQSQPICSDDNRCPDFGNGSNDPQPQDNKMEIEVAEELPAPSLPFQTQSEPTPSLASFPELLKLMAEINEFVILKTTFVENVINKVFWNDFLRQVGKLPSLPPFYAALPAINWTTDFPSIYKNMEMLYLVKWTNMSYADSTWERESELTGFDTKIKDYKRFTRAMDRETRKTFVNRFQYFNELQEIVDNPRTLERTSQSTLNDLRHRLFTYKDPKAVIQYTTKTQPIFKDQRMLRSYQLESLNWMIDAWTKRRNIILADEMGLGKTIQAMSFINHLIAFEHQPGPYLVIAPLSTLSHWKRVFEDWTHLNSILYYDSKGKAGREVCQNYEFNHWDITMKGLFLKDNHISKFSVMITSFEVFIQDFDSVFKTLPFQHIIIDEAHRLKNRNAKIISTLKRLVCQRIFLLTGTPIQNNLSELWSLLHFVEPSVFNDLPKFLENYENQMKLESLQKLKVALAPYLLRRMKEEVESSIPPLIETIIDVELTSVQKIVYKTLYEKNKGTLQKGLGFSGITLMNNLEMQLRKCCNHPFTIADIAENLTKDCQTNEAYFEKLVSSSGKMIFVEKALEKFHKESKKVLIFSQFTEVLRMLEEYLFYKQFRFYKIDGSTKARDRQIAIDKFNNNSNGFEVFLLSTKAGGLGINLTSASIVIIFDSDWNPQNDIQAIARAHRIGQTQEVKVFRLISKKTYESEMFERASKKLGLDQAILLATNYTAKTADGAKTEDFTKLRPDEIELLLRKGMIGLLHLTEEESTGEGQFGQSIDEIIQNARTANYSVINGLYTFGKTKFVGDAKDELLQIDDPDFWKKAFANQKTTIENFEKEYNLLVQSDRLKKLEVQKDFFLRLSEELYRYLNDRVTNEGFSADTEIKLCDLLIQIADNNKFNPVFRELASQLNADFNKGSRRIKKIDEKTLNSLLKLPNIPDENGKQTAETTGENYRRRRQLSPPSDASLGKRESMDDSDVYENEEEKLITNLRKEKKMRQEEKLKVCEFCGKKDELTLCKGFCGRLCHADCLAVRVSPQNELNTNCLIPENPETEKKEAFVDEKCICCRTQTTVCFSCKKSGLFSQEIFLKSDVGVKDLFSEILFKCSICPKFYHSSCMKQPLTKEEKTEKTEIDEESKASPNFQCEHHFCSTCGIYSKNMYQCIECPFASHKKCMSKKNKTLSGCKILCTKHQTKTEKVEKKPKLKKSEKKEVLEKTEKQTIKDKIVKTEKFIVKLTDKSPRLTKSKPKEEDTPTQFTSEPKRDQSRAEGKKEPKRNRASVERNEKKLKQGGMPTKKVKLSLDTNQKLTFGIFKPFDYSNYKKDEYTPIDAKKNTEEAYLKSLELQKKTN